MATLKRLRSLKQFISEHHIVTYANQDGVIDTLDLRSQHTTDEVRALLQEVPSIRRLSLQGTQITYYGLGLLPRLGHLEELDLRSCKRISDVGMAHVSKLDKLK